MDTIVNYEELLEKSARDKENKDISNSSLQHAEIGTRCLLRHAPINSTAMILSGHFYKPFWEKLWNDIEEFLTSKNGRIEILLVKKEDEGFGLARELAMKFKDKVRVWIIEPDRLENSVKMKVEALPNFMVIPDTGSRFEIADDKKQDNLVSAVLNFGNKTRENGLSESFVALKKIASKQAA